MAIKALRKPSISAWAVNQLARSDREHLDELLGAAAALRQAGTGDALRDATRDEREAVEALVESAQALLREAGQKVTDKTVAELRETLHAVAADDETRDLVDAGRLTEARRAIGLGAFSLDAAPALPASGKSAPKAPSPPKRPPADAEKKRRDAEERKRREAEERKRREAEEKKRRARIDTAKRALVAAEAKLERAESAAAAARTEVERRRSELEEAESR